MHAPHSGGGEFPALVLNTFFLSNFNRYRDLFSFKQLLAAKTLRLDAPDMWSEVT